MWRWMLPGGIVLGAALGGIIAASPHPARTAGDVTAIVVVVVAFGIPWLGMSSENRARRQWASQRDEAARALAPADRGSTAESAAGPGPSAASGPWLGSVIQGYDKMAALLGGRRLAWSTNHAPNGPAPATRRRRERGGFGAAMAVLLGGIACLPPASPGAASGGTTAPTAGPVPTTLNYAATTLGWSITPTIVAQEIGFFAAENLSVEMVIAGQSATVCQQLLARAVEIGNCSLNDTIQAIESSGAPLVVVLQETASALHNGLMVRPGLAGYADLRGKTVMLGGPKDNTVYFFRLMARANGLSDDDYDMTYAGSSSARYAALKAGGVDASLLTDPFDHQIEQEGFQRFDNLRPRYIGEETYAGNGTVVRKDWAETHADELVRYTRAMVRTLGWLNDPANRDELFAILGPRINLSAETFERSYRRAALGGKEWTTDGRAQASGYAGVLKSLVDLGYLSEPTPPPTRYYDMTYVERAHDSLSH